MNKATAEARIKNEFRYWYESDLRAVIISSNTFKSTKKYQDYINFLCHIGFIVRRATSNGFGLSPNQLEETAYCGHNFHHMHINFALKITEFIEKIATYVLIERFGR